MKKVINYFLIIIGILLIGGMLFYFLNNKQSNVQVIRVGVPIVSAGAPLLVMNELNLMDKYLPNSCLELIINESGSAMNEAIIANQIDGGIVDLTSFLVGTYRNVPYKILTSAAYGRMSLQTNDPNIRSIYDVRSNHLIGINSTTGTVALMLYLTAEKYFGSFDALNNQIVIMRPDDITLALVNNIGISLAFSNAAIRIIQNDLGCHTILEDTELFDGHLFTHYVVFNNVFHAENKKLIDAFSLAFAEAINLINNQDDHAITIVSEKIGIKKDIFIDNLNSNKFIFELNNFDSIDILTDMAIKIGLIPTRKPLEEIIFIK